MRGSPVAGAPTSSSSGTRYRRGQRDQELQLRAAGARLQARQRADRDAGRRRTPAPASGRAAAGRPGAGGRPCASAGRCRPWRRSLPLRQRCLPVGGGPPDACRMRDVVVIGGGAAGLSGAVTLARARRSVLVIDDGTPAERARRRGARAARAGGRVAARAAGARPGRAGGLRRCRCGPAGSSPPQRDGRRVRRDPGRRDDRARATAARGHRPRRRAARRSPACGSAGATTSCTARTATAGRCATSRSGCSPRPSARCTRRCCSGSGPTTSSCSSTPRPDPTPEQAEQLAARGIRVVPGVVAEVLVDRRAAQRRAAGVRRGGRAVRAHRHAAVRRAPRRARRSRA